MKHIYRQVSCFFFFIHKCWSYWSAANYLALATSFHVDDECENKGLSRRQMELCRMQPDLVNFVGEGVQRGIQECQEQLRDQRWNCTAIHHQQTASADPVPFKGGTREGALVHAITSAGVVWSLARGCATGDLDGCSCENKGKIRDHDEKGDYFLSGCANDIVRYAIKHARRFVDQDETEDRETTMRGESLVNLHNNRAGRKVIQNHLVKECKCHGVSGSCTLRTCWKAIPAFPQIGQVLKQKYRNAHKVHLSKDKLQIETSDKPERGLRTGDLIFLEQSPDYCGAGTLGTGGRRCKVNSTEADSCEILCCGRGYDTVRIEKIEKCHCKFRWCCEVSCQDCKQQVEEHVCKPAITSKRSISRSSERLRNENTRPTRRQYR